MFVRSMSFKPASFGLVPLCLALVLVFGLFLHTVSELLIHSHQGLHAVGVEKRQHVYNLGQQFDPDLGIKFIELIEDGKIVPENHQK